MDNFWWLVPQKLNLDRGLDPSVAQIDGFVNSLT